MDNRTGDSPSSRKNNAVSPKQELEEYREEEKKGGELIRKYICYVKAHDKRAG